MGDVLTIEALRAVRDQLRRDGKRLAFANGHFDLLHVGHLRYLRAARAEADRLVVAINNDRSVASLKGEGRPVVPEAERAEMLAALEPVDYVVVFSGDTPAPLITALQPDVHCKGYRLRQPGAGPRIRRRTGLWRPYRPRR